MEQIKIDAQSVMRSTSVLRRMHDFYQAKEEFFRANRSRLRPEGRISPVPGQKGPRYTTTVNRYTPVDDFVCAGRNVRARVQKRPKCSLFEDEE